MVNPQVFNHERLDDLQRLVESPVRSHTHEGFLFLSRVNSTTVDTPGRSTSGLCLAGYYASPLANAWPLLRDERVVVQ